MFYCGVVRGDLDNCLLKTMAGFFSFGTSDLTQTTRPRKIESVI